MSFGFREARSTSTLWNALKTMAQASVMIIVFLVIFPVIIRRIEVWLGFADDQAPSLWLQLGGIVILVLGTGLNAWGAWTIVRLGRGTPLPLDTAPRLVIRGPYRAVRNPMAIGGITQGVGVGMFLGSPLVVAYAIAGGSVWHVIARPPEERDLLARFGVAYARYRREVRCWISRIPPLTLTEARELEDGSRVATPTAAP